MYSTEAVNKSRFEPEANERVWVFGYGSLIHRVDFAYERDCYAVVAGWQRRFWMKSEDHRGTPESPGRVLTLVPHPQAFCFGRAFLINRNTLHELDYRERNGYLRHQLPITLLNEADGTNEHVVENALVFIGDPESPIYTAESDLNAVAHIIAHSSGPSGANREYVFGLYRALQLLQQQHPEHQTIIDDPELNTLVALVQKHI